MGDAPSILTRKKLKTSSRHPEPLPFLPKTKLPKGEWVASFFIRINND